jgi:hypothetical protein
VIVRGSHPAWASQGKDIDRFDLSFMAQCKNQIGRNEAVDAYLEHWLASPGSMRRDFCEVARVSLRHGPGGDICIGDRIEEARNCDSVAAATLAALWHPLR